MGKPDEEQCYDVIRFCISYLYDKFANERGLFRSTVSLTDVRLLQGQIVENGPSKYREDLDPHLVAEVLLVTLKDLKPALLQEVYQDILDTELSHEDFEADKAKIKKWIPKIPSKKLSIVKSFFRLLSRLATLEDNEVSFTQLTYTVSPTICASPQSAYMSIMHMEDLKKIRPVIGFIIEHGEDLLKEMKIPSFQIYTNNNTSNSNNGNRSTTNHTDSDGLANMLTSSMSLDINTSAKTPTGGLGMGAALGLSLGLGLSMDSGMGMSLSSFSNDSDTSSASSPSLSLTNSLSPFLRPPGLCVSIPGANNTANTTDAQPAMEVTEISQDDKNKAPGASSGLSAAEGDWRVLHMLVLSKVCGVLGVGEAAAGELMAKERESESWLPLMQAWSAKLASPSTHLVPSPLKNPGDIPPSSSPSPTHNKAKQPGGGRGGTSVAGAGTSAQRRGTRRKLVADCKALRTSITEFETEFLLKFSRLPKVHERGGNMAAVYARYRDLKREIREGAAGDIQRVFRGYRARKGLAAGTSTSPTPSVSLSTLLGQFVALRDQKKDLKKKLKKFDEDFQMQYHRAPSKRDKEVIRPLYQKYHELKSGMEEVRAELCRGVQRGAWGWTDMPEEVREEVRGTKDNDSGSNNNNSSSNNNNSSSNNNNSGVGGSGVGGGGRGNTSKYSAGDSDFEDDLLDRSVTRSAVSPTSPTPTNPSATMASPSAEGGEGGGAVSELESLQREKRDLHAYLKVYERDFNRKHGRPVMKNEDILPVANEYQRYKELKNLIREMKGGSS